jgi:hypothetical protein
MYLETVVDGAIERAGHAERLVPSTPHSITQRSNTGIDSLGAGQPGSSVPWPVELGEASGTPLLEIGELGRKSDDRDANTGRVSEQVRHEE